MCIIYLRMIYSLDLSFLEKNMATNIIIIWSSRNSKKRMHTTAQKKQYLIWALCLTGQSHNVGKKNTGLVQSESVSWAQAASH